MEEHFNLFCFFLHRNVSSLTHSFPMHLFSIPWIYQNTVRFYALWKHSKTGSSFWCFQGVEKGCSGNKWVKTKSLRRQKSLKNHTFRWNLVPLRSIVAIPPKQITSPHKNGLPNAVFASVAKVLSVVNNFKPWTSSLTFLYIEYISLLLFLSFSWSAKI